MREAIGRDDGVLQDAPARFDVVRVDVGEGLQHAEHDHEFADAADVLLVVSAMLGVSRVLRIGEVQHGEPVRVHAAGQDGSDLAREIRVRGRQVEGLAEQAQINALQRQQRAPRLFHVPHDTVVGETVAFQPADAGLLVSVERISGSGARGECCRRDRSSGDG